MPSIVMPSLFKMRVILVLLTSMLLSACSLLPGKQALQQQLSTLDNWQVRGKLSVRSPQDSVTGYLNWRQQNDSYEIFISGPFGQGSSELRGDDQHASLLLPGWQQPRQAANAAQLMQTYMGWNFPVSDIRYWVKGQPSPGSEDSAQYDDNGLLTQLNQHGWQVDYSRYQYQQGQWLPGLIKIKGHNFRFIFAIKEWTLLD